MKVVSTAVVLVGHGSRVPGFETAMKRLARALQKRLGGMPVRPAFLEINSPSIGEAIDACVASGAKIVNVLPYFLLTGRHVREDIPRLVREAQSRHGRNARIRVRPYLGFDRRILEVLVDRLGVS